jgi:xanthine dehydrogenase molybdopterin-binding subunit B
MVALLSPWRHFDHSFFLSLTDKANQLLGAMTNTVANTAFWGESDGPQEALKLRDALAQVLY